MAGIVSYGSYIPSYRLARAKIAEQWEGRSGPGEKAVASFDEDSLTMAIEASLETLPPEGGATPALGAVYFASTTSPYREKLAASILASVLDQPREIRTADFAGSLRAATTAFFSALDAIRAGSARSVLVSCGECRPAEPETAQEAAFGDAGAALLLGSEGVIAEIEDALQLVDEFTGTWRKGEDPYVRSFPGGFDQKLGYRKVLSEAIRQLLSRLDRKPIDYARLVIPGSNPRSIMALAKSLEFDPKAQLQDPLLLNVGDSGSTHPVLLLAAALESAKPGDRILWAGYGDGADVVSLRVTEAAKDRPAGRGIAFHLGRRRDLPSYGKYARFRKLMKREAIEEDSSPIVLWRERQQDLRRYGEKCTKCETIQFPRHRVCVECGSKDKFEDVRLSRRGVVHTFTNDSLVPSPDPPTTQAVIDLEGGGRVLLLMTDCDARTIRVGLPVELTFRKLHEGGGFHNYFWKARPAQER